MKIEEFRIVENYRGFQVQKQFKIIYPVDESDEKLEWRGIDCKGLPTLPNYDDHFFQSKQEAVDYIKRLCEPEKIHYPPF